MARTHGVHYGHVVRRRVAGEKWKTAVPPHVPVLMYHSVSDHATDAFRPYAVTPSLFREHMTVLAQRGCQVITLSERAAAIAAAMVSPPTPWC